MGLLKAQVQDSGGEGCHLQGDALPQLLGLLSSLQVLQHIIKLHHTHGCQTESTSSTADDVDKVIVICRGQVDEPMVDVLQREREGSIILAGSFAKLQTPVML